MYKLYTIKQKTGNKKVAKGSRSRGGGGGGGGGCCAILKSGKNIGKKCGVQCIGDGGGGSENNTEVKYCKKHYKMYSNS